MKKSSVVLSLVVALCLLLGVCNSAMASQYPVTITTYNYEGEAVQTTYDKAPEKVLAVYQGSIETLIALGLEDHVAASYGLDNEVKDEWKDGFAQMNYDDSVFAPDKETVMMMEPDMIFSWGSYFGEKTLGDIPFWIERGTNTYINTNTRRGGHPRTLENEYTDLVNIGMIFGVEDKAQALVDEMKDEITRAVASAEGQEAETVQVIEFIGDGITNYGGLSLGGDMVTQLGGKLAMEESATIGAEDVLGADADVIFVVYMAYVGGQEAGDIKQEKLDMLLLDPAYASLKAVQSGRVYPLMLGDMYASAVRTKDGIISIASGLYPALYAE